MKIAIIGSLKFENSNAVKEDFIRACKEIGKKIALSGDTLIIGSQDKATADYHVVKGMNEITGKHTVYVWRPAIDKKKILYNSSNNNAYQNINFKIRRANGWWNIVHLYVIDMADVIIIIGGGKGSIAASQSAPALKTPVAIISCFGGASVEICDSSKQYYNNVNLTHDEINAFYESWTDKSAATIINAVHKLGKHNNIFHKKSLINVISIFCLLFLLFVMWVLIFAVNKIASFITYEISIFLLSALACFLGSGARYSFRSLSNNDNGLFLIFSEFSRSIALVFGFILLFLLGQLVINGNISLNFDVESYRRVALSMSIIGFASAFLFEKAKLIIEKKMESFL